MSTVVDRRSRKRLATRQAISDTATRLFFERGFDNVTIDEIAAAADVGRMTVFNHFPRKEDLFFDRDEEARNTLRRILRERDPDVALAETLRLFVHRLITDDVPYLRFFAGSRRFVATIAGSEALKARARAIRDEIALFVATTLSEGLGRRTVDPEAHLAANLILATWTTAFIEAHHNFRTHGRESEAKTLFLALIDQGSRGVTAALAGTPYA